MCGLEDFDYLPEIVKKQHGSICKSVSIWQPDYLRCLLIIVSQFLSHAHIHSQVSNLFLQVSAVVENCASLQRLRLFGGRDTISAQALGGLANLSQLRELDLGLCVNVSQHTLYVTLLVYSFLTLAFV